MFFCFLWDDPQFNPDRLFTDPEDQELRRQAILTALDTLYITIARLKTWKEHWHEDVAREVWTWQQLLKHVPPEIGEQVVINRRVNTIDPDFSFGKAIRTSV